MPLPPPDVGRRERRGFLKAAGITFALPKLASLPSASAATVSTSKVVATKRMVCIGNMLGFYPQAFWPRQSGKDYEFPTTLASLERHRNHLTVISGLDHGVKGGHFAIHAFLSGVRHVDASAFQRGNQTIDQRAAETVGGQTRFESLTVGSESGIHGGCQMSWTRSGTRVPPITGPKQLFSKLFVDDDRTNQNRAMERFDLRSSILDLVSEDARSLSNMLGTKDKQKLDEYFTSIREVERRLQLRRDWVRVAKPTTEMESPANTNMVDDLPLLYELIALALQTDSTRIATLEIGGDFEASRFGYRKGYHGLSHHGQVQDSIDALIKIESYQVQQFSRFLDRLRALEDENGILLDQSIVLFGSGMGNANSHTNTNLPVILAGGGFRHGSHMVFDIKDSHRPPLTNLFVSMLQQFGVETDQFSTATGTLRGLEVS